MRASSIVPESFCKAASALAGNVQPIEENRLVLREEMKVVFESDEIILADFCIGGIGVFHIDRAFGSAA